MSSDSDLQLSFKERQKLFNDILSKNANSVAQTKNPEVPPRKLKNATSNVKPLEVPPELPPRRPSINSHDEDIDTGKVKRRETRRAVKVKKNTIRRSISPGKIPPSPKADRISRSPSRRRSGDGPNRIQTRPPRSSSRSPSPNLSIRQSSSSYEAKRRSASPSRFSNTPPPITSKPPPARSRSRSASPETIKRRPDSGSSYNTTIKLKPSNLSNGQYNYAKNTGTTVRKVSRGSVTPQRIAPSPPSTLHPYRTQHNIPCVDVAIKTQYYKSNCPVINLSTHPLYSFHTLSQRHPQRPAPSIPHKDLQLTEDCPDVPPRSGNDLLKSLSARG